MYVLTPQRRNDCQHLVFTTTTTTEAATAATAEAS